MENIKKKVLIKFPFQKEFLISRRNENFFTNQTNRDNPVRIIYKQLYIKQKLQRKKISTPSPPQKKR